LLADRTASPAEDAAESWLARVIELADPVPNAGTPPADVSAYDVHAVLLLVR
jgi:hypothetical protein